MSIRRKSVRGLFWSAAQSWGNQLVTLAVFIVLARLLSPANFGLVAMAKVFLSFVWIFLDQGLSMAIIQRRDLEQSHLSTAFWTNLAVVTTWTTWPCTPAHRICAATWTVIST